MENTYTKQGLLRLRGAVERIIRSNLFEIEHIRDFTKIHGDINEQLAELRKVEHYGN